MVICLNYKKRLYFIIYFLLIILIALIIINILKDISIKEEKESEQKEIKEEKKLIEYKGNQTIRIKLSNTNEIVAMDINDYLRGVVPSEMPPYYDMEALKAQAVVARTYLYRKMENGGDGDADICDNPAHCQAYYNKEKILEIWTKKGYDENLRNEYWWRVNEAVTSTDNQVILYNGDYIRAYFHASSPIRTESSTEIWGKEYIPYLISVENNESEEYENRTSTASFDYETFLRLFNEKIVNNSGIDSLEKGDVRINEYTSSGRVKNILVKDYLVSSEILRTVYYLRSTNFTIDDDGNTLTFNVIGNGHGLGMSQVGADFYGKSGMSYVDIIKHYYKGVEVKKLD